MRPSLFLGFGQILASCSYKIIVIKKSCSCERVKARDYRKSSIYLITDLSIPFHLSGTSKVGVGVAMDPDESFAYVVAKYEPVGNINGLYPTNVACRKRKSSGQSRDSHVSRKWDFKHQARPDPSNFANPHYVLRWKSLFLSFYEIRLRRKNF